MLLVEPLGGDPTSKKRAKWPYSLRKNNLLNKVLQRW
jgi:hypothetical protein